MITLVSVPDGEDRRGAHADAGRQVVVGPGGLPVTGSAPPPPHHSRLLGSGWDPGQGHDLATPRLPGAGSPPLPPPPRPPAEDGSPPPPPPLPPLVARRAP